MVRIYSYKTGLEIRHFEKKLKPERLITWPLQSKAKQRPQRPLKVTLAFMDRNLCRGSLLLKKSKSVHKHRSYLQRPLRPLFGLWLQRPCNKLFLVVNKLPAHKVWAKSVHKHQSYLWRPLQPLFGLWLQRPCNKLFRVVNKLPARKVWTKSVNKQQRYGIFNFSRLFGL